MFVILTSKPGKYATHSNADIEPVQTWDYQFYGHLQARFVVGRLLRETRVAVVEEEGEHITNWVPSKFLEHFDSLEDAHRELQQLVHFGSLDAKLVPMALPVHEAQVAPRGASCQ